jgi:general secretion pathway protein A
LGKPMYEQFPEHFGLQRNPFQVSPDSTHFYSTSGHDEALLQLVSRIEVHQGFMLLTGEAGTGKSTVLQYLLDWLKKYGSSSAYIFHPHVTFSDLLQMILQEFGVPSSSHSKTDLLAILKNWLIDQHRAGDSPVILIDEAQSLRSRTLNQLHRLLDLEIQGAKLVQIVLVGQPQLEEKLQQQRLARLRARLMWQFRLPALTPEETCGYIATRLAAAGSPDAAVFPEEALGQVYRYSNGIPRVINMLCEHACLAAYGDGRTTVTGNDVWRVACQFELPGTTELNTPVLPYETFCHLIRPKEAKPADEPLLELPAEKDEEQLLSSLADDTDEHAAVAEAVSANIIELVLAASAIENQAQQPEVEEQQMVVTPVPESIAEQHVEELAAPAALELLEPIPLTSTPAAVNVEFPLTSSLNAAEQVRTLPELTHESIPEFIAESVPEPIPEPAVAAQAVPRRIPTAVRERRSTLAANLIASLPRRKDFAKVAPKAAAMLRFRTRFAQYWRGVARSFVRDLHRLLDEYSVWLQKPINTGHNAATVRRFAIMISTWLKQPVGAGLVRREHPRIPSTAHKHFQS